MNQPKASLGPESGAESSHPMGNEKSKNYLDIITLIRSIQRAEGNPDCFLRGKTDCDRMDCAWRPYCLGKQGRLWQAEAAHQKEKDPS